jgi:xanthine phosphoribosyltransferase
MSTGAELLRRAILERGRVEGDLLKVDDFLNHRVDPALITAVGTDLAERFRAASPDLVLTAEASGIAPALACALDLDVPMVFAKKFLGPGDRQAHAREVKSPTRSVEYRVEVARRTLSPGLRVLVVDDFLAGGRTAEALGEIAEEAGCSVTGLGFVIEKTFLPGRDRLERHDWRVEALAAVSSLAEGRVSLGHAATARGPRQEPAGKPARP